MSWSRRLFRLLLFPYPRYLRRKHGTDMWVTFEHHLHDARLQGRKAVFDLWRRELGALWHGARLARISVRKSTRDHVHRNPTRRKSGMTLSNCSTDLKLGFRMLVKYPGLSIVSVVGMAVAIAIAAGAFGAINSMMDPTLPLDEGDRVVSIQHWDTRIGNPNRQVLHDFIEWRVELETIVDLGAYRPIARNLITADGNVEPYRVAEMTASGFRVARVDPVRGRFFVDEDERADAPDVVVIGHDVWQNRFAGNEDIIGSTVQLGSVRHTVIGIMPPDYAFPTNYRMWIPMRLNASDWERGSGPSITIFGRLAPGITFAEARAELSAVGQRAAAAYPTTHAQLIPQVLPYTYPFFDIDTPETARYLRIFTLVVSVLLVVVGVNIAILVYARTATRTREIAIRTALGAGRRRIIGQLFVEAVVLCGAAAIVGIVLTAFALEQINALIERVAADQFPFWLDFHMSSGTAVYAALLGILAAGIVGVIPAVQATGNQVHRGLQRLTSTATRVHLGRTWTTLIVGQVTIAMAALPATVWYAKEAIREGMTDPGFAADEFLGAQLSMDRENTVGEERVTDQRDFDTRFREQHRELVRRLEADPAVTAMTFALSPPGEERRVWMEIEGQSTPDDPRGYAVRWGSPGHPAYFNRVSTGYFDTFEVPILAGRGFTVGDQDTSATSVVVNRTFADSLLGGTGVIGQRIRYVGISGDADPRHVALDRWYRIVGVVPDFPGAGTGGLPVVYNVAASGDLYPSRILMGIRGGDAGAFAPRLREIAAAVDPMLRLTSVISLDEAFEQEKQILWFTALAICLITSSVLMLSSAGIYALMSFTVTQRRREIGIRTALGADRRNILVGIFKRSVFQLSLGVVLGALLAELLDHASGGELMNGEGVVVLPFVAVLMIVVGLAAAFGPARHGLRIQPTEALRDAD